MAFDGFIKFEGIEGESSDSKYAGWIEALECSMHIDQDICLPVSSAGGAAAGRADFGDFCFTKYLDKSTPNLAQAAAAGEHFNTITVALCRAGQEKVKFMEYTLNDAMISSISLNSTGDFPTETLAVYYAKVKWCYTMQKRRGGITAGNTATGWNCRKNCKM